MKLLDKDTKGVYNKIKEAEMEYNELILDMLNRIVKLEKEVELLKKEKTPSEVISKETFIEERPVQRDKTRYMFNGNVYLKNKLVLAIVKDYITKNKEISCKELKEVFDKSLQGSIGVVEYEHIAKQRKDYQVRFFAKEDEILRLIDGNMVVCSQWGILNISNFIKRAEQLGYEIDAIEENINMRRTNMTAEIERDFFWKVFDDYVQEQGDEFMITHKKGIVNQAAGNINNLSPMARETICCEYKFREQTILVQVYINKNEELFDYLYSQKMQIEDDLGYKLEWIKGGKISSSVRRIQKQFPINKPIKEMVVEIYPYILDFIRVFGKFLKS